MNQYFIKVGFSEKGPFDVEELRRFKITKQTYVRREDSDEWVMAMNVAELRPVFQKKSSYLVWILLGALGIAGLTLFAVLIGEKGMHPGDGLIAEEPLPPPPNIEFQLSKHQRRPLRELFKDCNLSGEKRQLVDACNYTNSTVRNTAVEIAGRSPGSFNLGQICDIFDYCTSNWKYVNDPRRREVVEYASRSLQNGLNGDCDDFAVVVCSMILAVGGEARINYAYGNEGGHAFTEVNLGHTGSDEVENYLSRRYAYQNPGHTIWTRTDNKGNKWLNLDWFASHPGGPYFDFTRGTTFYILQEYCVDFTR